jgi:hypothetical protein
MKKTIIIILALCSAFLASEFFVNKIVKYPIRTSSVKYVFMPDTRGFENLKLKESHSKYWSVEGGNNVYYYNNLSITGRDVYPDDKSIIVFVLGDSFVEASTVHPDSTAVTIFQDKLNKLDTNIKALNIGFPNTDPFILWYRMMFFEKLYKPDYVILLVEDLELLDMNMQRHPDSLDFSVPANFGSVIPPSKSERIFDVFRKRFSVFSLLSASISIEGLRKENNSNLDEIYVKDVEKSIRKFRDCMFKYKEKYGEKLVVLSFEENTEKNKVIAEVCDSMKINYSNKKLMTPEYRWENIQHLNNKGNKVFGEFLYETFIRIYKK